MRIAPLVLAGLVSISCGGRAEDPPPPVPHPLVGSWALRYQEGRGGIRVELRVDSVARDSAFGALTHYMAGNAGFLMPEDWGPLRGTVGGDLVRLVIVQAARAPELGFAGRLGADTIRLSAAWIGLDTIPVPTVLVRQP